VTTEPSDGLGSARVPFTNGCVGSTLVAGLVGVMLEVSTKVDGKIIEGVVVGRSGVNSVSDTGMPAVTLTDGSVSKEGITPGVMLGSTPGVMLGSTPGVRLGITPGVMLGRSPGVTVGRIPPERVGIRPPERVGSTPVVMLGRSPGVTVGRRPPERVGIRPPERVGSTPVVMLGRSPGVTVGMRPPERVGSTPGVMLGRSPGVTVGRRPPERVGSIPLVMVGSRSLVATTGTPCEFVVKMVGISTSTDVVPLSMSVSSPIGDGKTSGPVVVGKSALVTPISVVTSCVGLSMLPEGRPLEDGPSTRPVVGFPSVSLVGDTEGEFVVGVS